MKSQDEDLICSGYKFGRMTPFDQINYAEDDLSDKPQQQTRADARTSSTDTTLRNTRGEDR